MDTTQVAKIGCSFVAAGLWISAATLAGERLGSRLAGIVGSFPSTIVIFMIFATLTRGPGYVAAAAVSVPLGIAANTLFSVVFALLIPRGLAPALGGSIALWLGLAVLATWLPSLSLAEALVLYVLVSLMSLLFLEGILTIPSVPKRAVPFRFFALVARGGFAGIVVAGAVALAQVTPPYISGLISSFPAVTTASLVILTRSQGIAFARATSKLMSLSSASAVVYALGIALLFPFLGPWLGILAALLLAAGFIALLWPVAQRFA